jgi:hypothetical protein
MMTRQLQHALDRLNKLVLAHNIYFSTAHENVVEEFGLSDSESDQLIELYDEQGLAE